MPIPRHSQRGSTLVAAVIFVAIISSLTGIAFIATAQLGRNAQRTRQYEGAIAVGDAYIEWAFAQWRNTCRAQSNVALPSSAFGGVSAPTPSWLPQPANYTFSNFSIVAVDVQGNPLGSTVSPPPAQGQSNANNAYYYRASVDVTVPTITNKPVTAKVRRIFEKRVESPWEYAIFYNDQLEFHPSPLFVVTGWVHSNGWIYASPDGGNSLTFNDRVTFADGYKEGYMNGDWQGRGLTSDVGKAPGNTFAPGLPPASAVRKDFAGITPSQFNPDATSKNDDGYRELIEVPDAGVDPLTDSGGSNPRLYTAAGVKVFVDATNTLTVMNGAGTVMSPSGPPAQAAFYNAVVSAVSTNENIQDFREAASVRLVTLDVSKVNTAALPGWNGVVYISDRSASDTGTGPKRGVRLKNGSTLPAGGLTVVTDNPVYIQGDYNTSATRQPAAVMGDAIMILSNAWNDAASSDDINGGTRNATDTTINTALLGGTVPTDPSYTDRRSYSGGVENFPRFMENWSGKTLSYNGSMVELFNSKQAVGRWGTSSQSYNPPARNWAYETLFRTSPPPGTLFVTTYSKQRWYLD